MIVKTILVILLAVSLAFNAFVFGYLRVSDQPQPRPSMEDRARRMAEKLDLDQEQQALFGQFLTEYIELRQANEAKRQAFCDELLKAEPDPRVLENYSIGPEAVKYRLASLDLMRRFVQTLQPEQREMFVDMIRNRHSSSSETPKPVNE